MSFDHTEIMLMPGSNCATATPINSKIVAPHFDRPWLSRRWLNSDIFKTGATLIGIDECTAFVALDMDETREGRGPGFVTLHSTTEDFTRYGAGEKLIL